MSVPSATDQRAAAPPVVRARQHLAFAPPACALMQEPTSLCGYRHPDVSMLVASRLWMRVPGEAEEPHTLCQIPPDVKLWPDFLPRTLRPNLQLTLCA